jgi:hypothetical protein
MASILEQLLQEMIAEEIRQEEVQVQANNNPQRPTIELTQEMNDTIDSMTTEEMLGALKMITLLTNYCKAQKKQAPSLETFDGFRGLLQEDIDHRKEQLISGQRIEKDVQKIIADRSGSAKYSSYNGRRDDC